MIRKFIAWLFSRWAEQSANSALDLERDDHRATKHELVLAKSQNELLKAEVEFLAAWRSKELSRLEAENVIFRGRKRLGDDDSPVTE